MNPIIRSTVILAAIAASFLPSIARGETKKPNGGGAAKVHLCESVDVYSGAVDASHPSVRIAESCRDVSVKVATKAIDKCTSEGSASVCEVLLSVDKHTIMIERKILVSSEAN